MIIVTMYELIITIIAPRTSIILSNVHTIRRFRKFKKINRFLKRVTTSPLNALYRIGFSVR